MLGGFPVEVAAIFARVSRLSGAEPLPIARELIYLLSGDTFPLLFRVLKRGNPLRELSQCGGIFGGEQRAKVLKHGARYVPRSWHAS